MWRFPLCISLPSFIIEEFRIHPPLVSKYQKTLKDFHKFSCTRLQKETPTHPKVHKYLDFKVKRKAISSLIPPFLSEMKIDSQS